MQATGQDIDINVNGATICYDDLGRSKVPLIFIHGFPLDKEMWQPQIQFLKEKYRVIAYDIRGFGKSTSGDEKETIALFADDLVKLMDALEIDKAIVCGLSMGGYILLNAVNRYPNRFEAIILSDTQCIADSPETKEKRHKSIADINETGLIAFADGFANNIFCAKSLAAKPELVLQVKNTILATRKETITSTLLALAQRWEMCPSLKEIKVPALILCGKEDKVTPVTQSEFLTSKIPNASLQIINDAAHMSNLEQPDLFNKHVNDFVAALVK
jgi:3-oxoadipate enol-lactonase